MCNNYDIDVELTDEAKLQEDLAFDSLDVVETCMETETYFGVTISTDDMVSAETIGDFIKLFEKYLGEAGRLK